MLATFGINKAAFLETLVKRVFTPASKSDKVMFESWTNFQDWTISHLLRRWIPLLKWILERVQETCPRSDKVVRVAIIKTATRSFKRPTVKLTILPLEEDMDSMKD